MDIDRKLKQTAIYWGTPVPSGYGGFTYASPVEISIRWEDKQELFTNDSGEQELSRAVIYANQNVSIGGYLYLGEESDLDSSHDQPEIIDEAYRIKAYASIPNVRATNYLRKIWL